ncbi:MAG: hypothetical protein AAF429_10305 [Pseudomonadota bacterium]
MNMRVKHRGAAAVGYLDELDPVASTAVAYLRLWCDGVDAQMAIDRDFATAFGVEQGRIVSQSFGQLCKMCVHHARRPLMRHGVNCRCLGADESCFANFIGYASEGAREDALMMAMTIVPPEKAHILAGLAEEFGMALRKMAVHFHPNVTYHNNQTLH